MALSITGSGRKGRKDKRKGRPPGKRWKQFRIKVEDFRFYQVLNQIVSTFVLDSTEKIASNESIFYSSETLHQMKV